MATTIPATLPEQELAERRPAEALGQCPRCAKTVRATAEAVRYSSHWYHVRCALEERAASER
jgi:uncharacterized C2H2 Zn-finger protein